MSPNHFLIIEIKRASWNNNKCPRSFSKGILNALLQGTLSDTFHCTAWLSSSSTDDVTGLSVLILLITNQ